jgi:hypothetical protein
MFDTLEGLDYKAGECSMYVAQILSDVNSAIYNGELVKKSTDHIQVGDVIVRDYNSQLVLSLNQLPRITISPRDTDSKDARKPEFLVIPDSVLRSKQRRNKRSKSV